MENTRGAGSSTDQAIVFHREGIVHENNGDYGKAIVSYTRALSLREDALTYEKRAGAHYMKHDLDSAIDDLNRAIRLEPDNAVYYADRGNIYTFKHDYAAAIADYNQAIRFAPGNAVYYAYRAGLYSFNGDNVPAITDFTQAIRFSPDKAEYYASRGNMYLLTENFESAIADFTQAVKLDPDKAEYHNYRDMASTMAEFKKAPDLKQSDARIGLDKAETQINYWNEVKRIQNHLKFELLISTTEATEIISRITGKLGYFFTMDHVYHSAKRKDILSSLVEAGKKSGQWVVIEELKIVFGDQKEEYVIAEELTEDELVQSASALEQVISQLEREANEYVIKQKNT